MLHTLNLHRVLYINYISNWKKKSTVIILLNMKNNGEELE